MPQPARCAFLGSALLAAAGLLVSAPVAAANVRHFAVDVPTTLAGGITLLPRQIVELDGASYSIAAELPADVEIVALDRLPDSRWLFAPTHPVLLGAQWFGPRDIVLFDGSSFTSYFDGASAGVPSYAGIDAVSHDAAGSILLSFDVPVALAGVEYGRSDLVRWSGSFSLAWNGAAAGVPAYANLVGVDRAATGSLVLGFDVPVDLGGMEILPGESVTWDGTGFTGFESATAWPRSSRMRDFVVASATGPPGAVPDGSGVPGVPLTLAKPIGGAVVLSWSAACGAGAVDYAIYEGTIGAWSSHVPRACTTGGATTGSLTPTAADAYYLVVPRSASTEGSYGRTSAGTLRPQSAGACFPHEVGSCP